MRSWVCWFSGRPVLAEETIKLAYTDPFSGPFASGGDEFLKAFQFIIARKNAAGGALGRKFELVPFDDKLQPAEALIALKNMTDQNIPFVMHCTGSNVGSALIDAVSKHNARNPDNRILYLNCGALATELTNEQCDFWHFRFAGSVDMRAAARIKSLPPDLKKVYLLNQDYLFGQSIQHDTKKWLAKLRPDIEIVGDELMPFGKVQDFSPYVAKIKASGAQSVVTGNYNRDLNLLIKAGGRCRPQRALRHFPVASDRRADRDRRGRREPPDLGDGVQRQCRGRPEERGGGKDRHRLAAPTTRPISRSSTSSP